MATREFSDEELATLKAIAESVTKEDIERLTSNGMTRREALAALAGGAAIGGVGANELIGSAQADASTSDSDGNVGLPGDRVDLFANGADIDEVIADERAATWVIKQDGSGGAIAVGPDSVFTGSDPAAVIQGRINNSERGDSILLRKGRYKCQSAITLDETKEGIEVYGQSAAFQFDSNLGSYIPDGAVLDFANLGTTTDCFTVNGAREVYLHDFCIDGNGGGDIGFQSRTKDTTGGPYIPRMNRYERIFVDRTTNEGFDIQGGWAITTDLLIAHAAGSDGFLYQQGANGGGIHDCNFGLHYAWNTSGDGHILEGVEQSTFEHLMADGEGSGTEYGIRLRSNNGAPSHNLIESADTEEHGTSGIFVQSGAGDNSFGRVYVSNTQEYGINIGADRIRFVDRVHVSQSNQAGGYEALNVASTAADTRIDAILDLDNGIRDVGTRTKRFGIIGGYELGGVNISNVTGAAEGEIARTTGGSAAGADVLAVFNGTDWVYMSRGGTVTPS